MQRKSPGSFAVKEKKSRLEAKYSSPLGLSARLHPRVKTLTTHATQTISLQEQVQRNLEIKVKNWDVVRHARSGYTKLAYAPRIFTHSLTTALAKFSPARLELPCVP